MIFLNRVKSFFSFFPGFLVSFVLVLAIVLPVFSRHENWAVVEKVGMDKNTLCSSVGDEPSDGGGSIPIPATSGFILDAYNNSWINVSVNQSHFLFSNSYINQSLEHIDVFVPEDLQDDMGYVTPCNPSLMVCQQADAPDPIYGQWDLFHVLNDWTNSYGNRFYIETDYIFNYAMYDGDNDIPEGFNWLRVNEEVRVNYSDNNSGIGDLFNTRYEIDDSHNIRINVTADDYNLVLNYTYFYNDEIVGQFEDTYLSYIPPVSDKIVFKGDNNRLNVSVDRNNPTVQYYKNDDAFFNVSYDIVDTDNISIDISNNSFYQYYSDKDFVYYPIDDSSNLSFEYGLVFHSMPSSNTLFFDIEHDGLVFIEQSDGILAKFDTADVPSGVFNNVGSCFFIPSPMVFDSDNNSVNGTVEIIGSQLKIVIPQSFLGNAVYPVFVDPSFTLEDTQADGGSYYGVWGDGTYIYTACYTDGIRAYTFDGSSFTLKDTQDDGGTYYGVWGDDTYVYTACGTYGVRAYTFDGNSFSNVLDTKDDGGSYWGVWGDGTYIYTACYDDGVRAYTFDGNSFTLKDTQDDGGYYRSIWGDGTYVYAGCGTDGVRAYTFDGNSFTLKDTDSTMYQCRGVFANSDYVFTANSASDAGGTGGGISAYTFDGNSFTLEDQQIDGDGDNGGVWSDGTYAYLAGYDEGVRAYSGFASEEEPTNNAPVLSNENPANNSVDQSLSLTWNITINDPDGDTFNWTIECSNSDTNSANDASNGSKTLSISGLSYSTTYKVYVNCTDGTDWTREWYDFTTRSIDINTSIDTISPYDTSTNPLSITATSSGDDTPDNVTLYYRWSDDNTSWSGGGGASVNWYDTGWTKRKLITINNSKVAGDLNNYPVYIEYIDSDLSSNAHADGYDIIFVDYSDNSTKYSHELVNYSSGTIKAFINVTILSGSSDTKIWMYYDNDSISSSQEDITGTWDNHYVGVWHLEEDPSVAGSGGILDSTSNNIDGTDNGGMDSNDIVAGATGNALEFDGNDYIDLGNNGLMDFGTDNWTIEAWVNHPNSNANQESIVCKGGDNSGGIRWALALAEKTGDSQLFTLTVDDNSDKYQCEGNDDVCTTLWEYVVATRGSNLQTYHDTSTESTTGVGDTYDLSGTSQANAYIGAIWDQGSSAISKFMTGKIDEVRVSDIFRGTDYRDTTYNTINDPSGFSYRGSEEQYSAGSGNGCDWRIWSDASNPDTGSPWGWSFDFPNSTGYYEFYSIAQKSGTTESAPGTADARCNYTAGGLSWHTVINTVNGSYSNSTNWNSIISTVNGSYSNSTSWNNVITTINGSYSNTTSWVSVISTINGSYSNSTSWCTITSTINGSYSNTTNWVTIDDTINGSYSNTTSYHTITSTINGSYSNTSIGNWLNIEGRAVITASHEKSSLQQAINGTNAWNILGQTPPYYFVLDLKETRTITKLRARSITTSDPTDVNIYIDNDNPPTTLIEQNISDWQDNASWQIVDITNTEGRYIKVEVIDTESALDWLVWGKPDPEITIFDVNATGGPIYYKPAITINFAGNHSDSGGPYYTPPLESDTVADTGYYTNNSRQIEDWIYINATIPDATSVYLNWLNETSWTNDTYTFTNTAGDYWEINTSGTIQTHEGYNYSFDIKATNPDYTVIENWNKTGLGGGYHRRYVQLNCTTKTNISYRPYYLYDISYDVGDTGTYDRLNHDQGPDGTVNDTGYLMNVIPSDTVEERHCGSFVGYWFEDSVCVDPFSVSNMYTHFWWNSSDGRLEKVSIALNRQVGNVGEYYATDSSNNHSTVTYSGYDYYLETKLLTVDPVLSVVDNNIYELYFMVFGDPAPQNNPRVVSNLSFNSFILFNVPVNTTLKVSDTDSDNLNDWEELYITFTNPFLNDTDNDGVTDYYENLSGSDPNDYTDTIPYTTWHTVISTINGSYSNSTSWNNVITTINGSYSNSTSWVSVISTINGSYSNSTSWCTITSTINGSYSNSTSWTTVISTINGSYSNTTVKTWNTIIDTINGSYSNSTSWVSIISTINGTYSNTTNWVTIDDTINGSYTNTTIWNTIISTINGSYYNGTAWSMIDNTINGSYSNTTDWNNVITTVNGSYSNTTSWTNIITTINGSYSNTTSWSTITSTINGSYSNTTNPPTLDSFTLIDEGNTGWDLDNNNFTASWNVTDKEGDSITLLFTFGKGLILNVREPTITDYDAKIESATNQTRYDVSITNNIVNWSDYTSPMFPDVYVRCRIYDGTHYGNNITDSFTEGIDGTKPTGSIDNIPDNTNPNSITGDSADATSKFTFGECLDLKIKDKTDNDYWTGAGWGGETWIDLSDSYSWSYDSSGITWDNGHLINITLRVIDDAGNINASADTEEFTTYSISWQTATNTINGSYTNTTSWVSVISTINGSYSNTTSWSTIIDTVNGSYSNSTSWTTVISTINGSYSNTTVKTWNTIISTINGSYSNTTSWVSVVSTVNGSYSNSTSWNNVITTINGSYSNTTSWTTVISTINGSYSNNTGWTNIITTINGSYTNTTQYPQMHHPDPANNSIENPISLTWNITIYDNTGNFNWNITCNNGQHNNQTADTNGSKTLTLTSLDYGTIYTIWVNTTNGNGIWNNQTFYFTTTIAEVSGDFTYSVDGHTITVNPSLGLGVDFYKWKIENNMTGETEWINTTDTDIHRFTVNWNGTYLITLFYKNSTISRFIRKYIGVGTKEHSNVEDEEEDEYTYPAETIEEGNNPPDHGFRNLFENIKIDRVHGTIIAIIVMILVFLLLMDRKRKRKIYTRIKKQKRGNKK